MNTKHSTTKQKSVNVIARIEFKSDARKVVYKVLSSNGQSTYETFFFNGKGGSCTCPATKPCYHMTQLEAREQARSAAAIETRNAMSRYQLGYHD